MQTAYKQMHLFPYMGIARMQRKTAQCDYAKVVVVESFRYQDYTDVPYQDLNQGPGACKGMQSPTPNSCFGILFSHSLTPANMSFASAAYERTPLSFFIL
jgi:hypothetical protein